MIKKNIEIKNETGIHARPASIFVREASKYKCNISINHNGKIFNAKSIIAVLSSGLKKGTKMVLMFDGEDEVTAAEELVHLVEEVLTSME